MSTRVEDGVVTRTAPVVVLHHADGTTETLRLNHSFATSQLEWFKKGSALNLFHGK